jgi:hypothetical protein
MGIISAVHRFVGCIAITSIAVAAFASQTWAAGGADYAALVAQAKAGQTMDFGKLRDAYAESADYDPYGTKISDLIKEMKDAAGPEQPDCKKIVSLAQNIVEKEFVSIDAHLFAGKCYGTLGQSADAEREKVIWQGLLKSIMTSGDGKTPQTAYQVVTIAEEYIVLSTLGLQMKSQALVDKDGGSYDVMTSVSQDNPNAQEVTVYFRIDRIFGSLSKQLQ